MMKSVREPLNSFESIEIVIEAIKKAKHIIVVTGAGISVSCGIPDFRSKDVGIYHNLDIKAIDIPSPELLFDLEYFLIDPLPFYKFSRALVPTDIAPSFSHKFIALLQQKRKLLRNYTQNIDGLERKCGISSSKLIECHGSMSTFKCMGCQKKVPLNDILDDIFNSTVCYCKYCNKGNVMKPMVTFFGEEIPEYFHKAISMDIPKCDLILVIGTSLKVGGSVHKILSSAKHHIPQILINRDAVNPPKHISNGFDATLLGDCDHVIQFLCDSLGWYNDDNIYKNKTVEFLKVEDRIFKLEISDTVEEPSQATPGHYYLRTKRKRRILF